MRREKLKLQIDDYSNDTICKIDQTKQDCIKLAKEINKNTRDIENYKTDLNTLIQKFELNDENYDEILSKANISLPKFEDILDVYKFSLLNNSDHEFMFEDMTMEDVFGSFISYIGGKEIKLIFLYIIT